MADSGKQSPGATAPPTARRSGNRPRLNGMMVQGRTTSTGNTVLKKGKYACPSVCAASVETPLHDGVTACRFAILRPTRNERVTFQRSQTFSNEGSPKPRLTCRGRLSTARLAWSAIAALAVAGRMATIFGRFDAFEKAEARQQFGGTIESVNFRDGALVNKGDTCFVMDQRP